VCSSDLLDSYGQGYGTLFRLSPEGDLQTLLFFDGVNGGDVCGPLVPGTDGYFYGIAYEGGTFTNNFVKIGFGTAFKVSTNGALTTLLSFDGTNGAGSLFGLVQGLDGKFYGTADGGTNHDSAGNTFGIIFQVTPDGTCRSLFSFNGTNGAWPRGLLLGRDGNFYGMTGLGGAGYSGYLLGGQGGHGTIFRVAPDGSFTNLVLFTGDELPFSGLMQARDGNLYGTTRRAGTYDAGTIFRLSVPMPPVLQVPTQAGGTVTLTWTAVAGQTYQLQYSSTPTSTNWLNLGAALTATNGTMTVSISNQLDPQRFYRVALLP